MVSAVQEVHHSKHTPPEGDVLVSVCIVTALQFPLILSKNVLMVQQPMWSGVECEVV